MNLNETAVFVKVVQAGSFSAAARQLALPVSTVSTQVARLEKRLGTMLLQRTTRHLSLTEAGDMYFREAELGLGHMLEAEAAVTSTTSEAKGLLRITAPADIGDALLAGLACRVRRSHPMVDVEMLLTDRYVDLVAEGVDAAIRTGVLKDSSLVAKQVGVAIWALYASPEYIRLGQRITKPQDLRKHPCMQFTPFGKEHWTLFNESASVTVPFNGRITVNHVGIIRTMALSSEGIGLLPTYLCRKESEDGKLVRVLPDWYVKADPVSLVYPRQKFVSTKLRIFLDIAASELHDLLG
jgi:DNA-binding transcriptional LysR family regulator